MRSPDILNAANAELLESLYRQYRSNPGSVDGAWAELFSGLDGDAVPVNGHAAHTAGNGATHGGTTTVNGSTVRSFAGAAAPHAAAPPAPPELEHQTPVSGVYALIQAYRDLGHLEADINPLRDAVAQQHPLLNLWEFGFSESDLDKHVGRGNFLGPTDGTLRDLIRKLRTTYCGKMGVEYMHITDKEQRLWLQVRMEQFLNRPPFSRDERVKFLHLLTEAEGFEQFLHKKFVGKKRFSLEGADALIPMLDTVITEGAGLGVEEIVLGMAHRGRLNVLANTMHKPLEMMFAEVKDAEVPKEDEGDGDVKYHLGYSHDRHMPDGRKVHLSLSFNPSHLELVNPVVEGMVRAKQNHLGDHDRSRVVPVLIHGDAAFTGQGIVMETLTLCRLVGYKTGGTVHIVTDNQVGFTAEARECRFTPYPTDIMKMAQAPIFHVNADDPEAVVHATKLAVGFRQRFKTDVMIHLLGYRRWGHNETDEPRFTQPLMYQKIDAHKTARELYEKKLREEGQLSEAESSQIKAEVDGKLASALAAIEEHKPKKAIASLGGVWKGLGRAPADLKGWQVDTGVSAEVLLRIIRDATRIPEGFNVDRKIRAGVYEKRLKTVEEGKGIDWGTGEVLAFGSLLLEGTPVRLVGQDAERGTFTHRHAVMHDNKTGETYTPLSNLGAGKFTVLNTMLSELAVMGFEYGFSSADPWTLVLWEAQFGDFVNGAQAMIDQYLVAAESKWQRMNSLVLLLPHGYEGQGPEHSNGRPERFLQLCAENNIQVCWPTTPAQHFHMLRRQMKRNFRKPLVVMTPKSLLRAGSGAVSDLSDFTHGGFRLVIDDPAPLDRAKVKRIIFCSGKVYYTLAAAREAKKVDNVAIVRLEQLYPFPADEVRAAAAAYPNASECFWVQEEPRNMGGWRFVRNRLAETLPVHLAPVYRGRKNAASPATGSFRQHEHEEQTLIADSLAAAAPPPGPTESGVIRVGSPKTEAAKAKA